MFKGFDILNNVDYFFPITAINNQEIIHFVDSTQQELKQQADLIYWELIEKKFTYPNSNYFKPTWSNTK